MPKITGYTMNSIISKGTSCPHAECCGYKESTLYILKGLQSHPGTWACTSMTTGNCEECYERMRTKVVWGSKEMLIVVLRVRLRRAS